MRRLVGTLLLVTLVSAGCGGDDSAEKEPPISLPGRTNNHGTATAEDNLEIEADDFYFGPTYIKASAGQKFSVELHNEGSARHTFTSVDLGVDLELAPGGRRTVTLTAPATGLAGFNCRFHQSQGMQGVVYIG